MPGCVMRLEATLPVDRFLTSIIQPWGLAEPEFSGDQWKDWVYLGCYVDQIVAIGTQMEWGDDRKRALHIPSRSFQVFLEYPGEDEEEELPSSSLGSSALTSEGSLVSPTRPPAPSGWTAAASWPAMLSRCRFIETVDLLWPSPCSLCSVDKLDFTKERHYW